MKTFLHMEKLEKLVQIVNKTKGAQYNKQTYERTTCYVVI